MKEKHYKRWLAMAPLGLVLVGAGLSLVADAASIKASGAAFGSWFWYGTFSLMVFNGGLCVFGQAVVHRVHFEQLRNDCD